MSGAAFETLPTGFYFGLLSDRHDFTESPMIGYWNRLRDPPGGIRNENLALFEIFTSADHGSVIDYREKDGRIEPAFRGTGNNTALEWGLTALQGGILRFCSSWVEDGPGETLPLNAYQETTRQIYRKFYRQPTGEEARVWGTFRHSDQQAEDKYEYLVPDMSCWRMVGTLLFNRTHRPFWWFEGAIARGGFVLPLQLYIFLRAAKRRWIDKACVL
jgi:hypothetical protein